jgi:hypothetical protein
LGGTYIALGSGIETELKEACLGRAGGFCGDSKRDPKRNVDNVINLVTVLFKVMSALVAN